MAYRHVKSVLGETNLERKCRFLFGACVSLLVAASFMWVWMQTENLVLEKDQTTGSLLVDAIMLKVHWGRFDEARLDDLIPNRIPGPPPDIEQPTDDAPSLVKEMSDDLQYQSYKWEYLSLEPSAWTTVPTDPWEYAALEELQLKMQTQLQQRQQEYHAALEAKQQQHGEKHPDDRKRLHSAREFGHRRFIAAMRSEQPVTHQGTCSERHNHIERDRKQ